MSTDHFQSMTICSIDVDSVSVGDKIVLGNVKKALIKFIGKADDSGKVLFGIEYSNTASISAETPNLISFDQIQEIENMLKDQDIHATLMQLGRFIDFSSDAMAALVSGINAFSVNLFVTLAKCNTITGGQFVGMNEWRLASHFHPQMFIKNKSQKTTRVIASYFNNENHSDYEHESSNEDSDDWNNFYASNDDLNDDSNNQKQTKTQSMKWSPYVTNTEYADLGIFFKCNEGTGSKKELIIFNENEMSDNDYIQELTALSSEYEWNDWISPLHEIILTEKEVDEEEQMSRAFDRDFEKIMVGEFGKNWKKDLEERERMLMYE